MVTLDVYKMKLMTIMCVVKINTFLTEFVQIVVLLLKIAKNVTIRHALNASQNISDRLMEQLAHYVEVQWLDAKSVTT